MLESIGRLKSNFLLNEIPFLNSILFFLLVGFVFDLEAVIGEMDAQVFIILNILLSVVIDSESQVAGVEQS